MIEEFKTMLQAFDKASSSISNAIAKAEPTSSEFGMLCDNYLKMMDITQMIAQLTKTMEKEAKENVNN